MKSLLSLAAFFALLGLTGCQSPRTSYAEGLIFWCSMSAIGIGFGKYIEVPAGGKLSHSATNSAPALIATGQVDSSSVIEADNTASNPTQPKLRIIDTEQTSDMTTR